MNTDFSAIYSTPTHSESFTYTDAQTQLQDQFLHPKGAWTTRIQWKPLVNQLFCRSVLLGVLLAAFSMPFPAWLVTGVSLFLIAKPDVNKAVADMMLTTFSVVALGILWKSVALVSGFNLYAAIFSYGAIAIGIAIAGIFLLIATSAALVAANSRLRFLDPVYFGRYQAQLFLAGISILGMSVGYWVISLYTLA
ncbi:MAG: hypothetical protein AAF327_00665 [Cyanobacteria bacterium P01_A01_bin.37]